MIIVLMATFNGITTLPKVLDAYCQLERPQGGWQLIIADDGSDDGTPELLKQYASRLPLTVINRERGGKNAALNAALDLALAESGTDLFVFTDDDATPHPDWLVQFQACARAHPDYALFGGTILPDWAVPPPEQILRHVPIGITFGVGEEPEGPTTPNLIWGANMAVRRSVFDAGLRFDAKVGPNRGAYRMGSETEFNGRVVAAGFRPWFCAGATVLHFIRPHQLTLAYALQRAYRFGRSARNQQIGADTAPRLFGVPRWVFAKMLRDALTLAWATVRRNADAAFRSRWQLHYHRGMLYQARLERQGQR